MRVSSDPAPAPASPRVSALTACGVLLTLAAAVFAGPRNDFGHDFVVIGDPGNRAVNFDEGRRFFPPFASHAIGRVEPIRA